MNQICNLLGRPLPSTEFETNCKTFSNSDEIFCGASTCEVRLPEINATVVGVPQPSDMDGQARKKHITEERQVLLTKKREELCATIETYLQRILTTSRKRVETN